jgi:hypothetical protein
MGFCAFCFGFIGAESAATVNKEEFFGRFLGFDARKDGRNGLDDYAGR